MKTLDNNRFIRFWSEIDIIKAEFSSDTLREAKESKCKWFPINHGGSYRKYYGNNLELVNWQNDGSEIKALAKERYNSITRTVTNIDSYFKEGITWTTISTGKTSFRRFPKGFFYSVTVDKVWYLMTLDC